MIMGVRSDGEKEVKQANKSSRQQVSNIMETDLNVEIEMHTFS